MENNILSKINSLISSYRYELEIKNDFSKKDTEDKIKGICSDIGCVFVELNSIFLVIECNAEEIALDIEDLTIKIDPEYHEKWGNDGFDPYLSKLR
ncbi:hypothetical protein R3O67_31705 [Bacillus cereus]|uniref:hypothetical protein n=1 Tax=Bacillus cereus TaxID=1396 RepID=UPI003079DC54